MLEERARLLSARNNAGQRLTRRRGRAFSLLLSSAFFSSFNTAHAYQVQVTPKIVYNDTQNGGPFFESVADAWAHAQSLENKCSGFACTALLNLQPTTTESCVGCGLKINGIPYLREWQLQWCVSRSSECIYSRAGYIQTNYVCPQGFGAKITADGANRWIVCISNFPDSVPLPKGCGESNPTYPAKGRKVDNEIELVSSVPNGSSSIPTSAFADHSAPAVGAAPCYRGAYVDTPSGTVKPHCFPYRSDGPRFCQ